MDEGRQPERDQHTGFDVNKDVPQALSANLPGTGQVLILELPLMVLFLELLDFLQSLSGDAFDLGGRIDRSHRGFDGIQVRLIDGRKSWLGCRRVLLLSLRVGIEWLRATQGVNSNIEAADALLDGTAEYIFSSLAALGGNRSEGFFCGLGGGSAPPGNTARMLLRLIGLCRWR